MNVFPGVDTTLQIELPFRQPQGDVKEVYLVTESMRGMVVGFTVLGYS
jgi:hypothetical protein